MSAAILHRRVVIVIRAVVVDRHRQYQAINIKPPLSLSLSLSLSLLVSGVPLSNTLPSASISLTSKISVKRMHLFESAMGIAGARYLLLSFVLILSSCSLQRRRRPPQLPLLLLLSLQLLAVAPTRCGEERYARCGAVWCIDRGGSKQQANRKKPSVSQKTRKIRVYPTEQGHVERWRALNILLHHFPLLGRGRNLRGNGTRLGSASRRTCGGFAARYTYQPRCSEARSSSGRQRHHGPTRFQCTGRILPAIVVLIPRA